MRAAAALLVLATAAAAQEATATLKWRTGNVGESAIRRIPLHEQAPGGLRLPDEPKGVLYCRFPLGDKALLTLVVDQDSLLIDRDFDGDLKEEKAVGWYGQKHARYRNVHLEVPFLSAPEPQDIQVLIGYRPQDRPPRLTVTARAYRRGSVVLAGRERLVLLADSDGDLSFDKPDHDRLFLDLDGNGKLELEEGSHEELRAGVAFHLKGRGFLATVPDSGGGTVVFRELAEAPPPARRPWKTLSRNLPGRRASGAGNLEALAVRYNNELEVGRVGWLRASVVRTIGQVGTREAFALLMRVYKRDEDGNVRLAAVEGMAYLQYADHADKVAKIARTDKSPMIRTAAIRALHGMAAPEREQVYARLLGYKQEQVAAAAAKHLGYMGTASARKLLREAAERGPRIRNRYHAYVSGTRYFERPPSAALMRACARSADPRLAAAALRDMHYFLHPETRALALQAARGKVRSIDLALVLVELLATDGSGDAVTAVLPLFELESATLRGRLQDLLAPVRDPGGVAAMAKGLSSRTPAVRRLCARVLGGIRDPLVTDGLAAQLLKERDAEVAADLVKALARHGGAKGGEAIVQAARRHERNDTLRRTILRVLADIGVEHEAVRLYFEAKLGSNSWEERVLAIGAAARAGAASMAPAILANLDHRAWQVRLAASEAFRRIRVREAIGPLIGRLGEEQEPRIVRAIGETLLRITGRNFFVDYQLWARWWRGARATFRVPVRIERAKRRPGTRTVARFYGLPVDSERIVFVVDQSGSMSSKSGGDETDYEKAVIETMKVVHRLTSRAKINVILFETDVHAWRRKLVGVNQETRAALKKYLDRHGPTGGTNFFDALEMALLHKGVDTIFLLSDGAPSSGKLQEDGEIVREVRRINELKRITIHCVSLGRDSTLLRRIAEEHGGRYTRR